MIPLSETPERSKATIAAFAAERLDDHQDAVRMFQEIGRLAVEGIDVVRRKTVLGESAVGDDGIVRSIPPGTDRVVVTGDEFADFIKSTRYSDNGGSKTQEGIEYRTRVLRAYGDFKPVIDELRAELAVMEDPKLHPNFLGSGSNSRVYTIELNGKIYVVRMASGVRGGFGNGVLIDGHLAGAALEQDNDRFEKIVAASYEECVTVSEKMPGKSIRGMTPEDILAVTDEQLELLVSDLEEARDRGVRLDTHPSNIFYDTQKGFGIIDYNAEDLKLPRESHRILASIASTLSGAGHDTPLNGTVDRNTITVDDYAYELEVYKANLGLLRRYRALIVDRPVSEGSGNALIKIDLRIQYLEEQIADYSNPAWVTESIAYYQD